MNTLKKINFPFLLCLSIILFFSNCQTDVSNQSAPTALSIPSPSYHFQSASSVAEVRAQIEKLPTEDIWWNVYGKDQSWNFKNLHRFLPTVNIYRAGQVSILQERPMEKIPNHLVETPEGKMTFKEFLDSEQSTTMGIVILHKGDLIYEYYPRQEPYEKPIYWSVTKVLVSAVVGILEDRGQVEVSQPISKYIPELVDSDFSKITVRNILDMASGVACQEEYEDWESCYYQYSITIGDGFWDDKSPRNPYKMLAKSKPGFSSEQGTEFQYSGVNTFLLSWLVEKITGMPFQDAFTKEIWSKLGTEADASLLAPRYGVPNTHGGLLARLRDVARFGLLYTPSYTKVTQEKIISDRVIQLIRNDGNPKLWEKSFQSGAIKNDFSHSAYQWDQVYQNHDFFKGGWGGQGLLVNPDKDVVAVFTGYYKDVQGSEVDLLPILREVLKGIE